MPADTPASGDVRRLCDLRPGDVIVGPFGRYELMVETVTPSHIRGRYTKVVPTGYELGSIAVYLRRDWPDEVCTVVRSAPDPSVAHNHSGGSESCPACGADDVSTDSNTHPGGPRPAGGGRGPDGGLLAGPIRQQFADLRGRYAPDATLIQLAHGAHVLRVPGVELPDRWTPRTADLLLELPPGFPLACPADFWTEDIHTTPNGRWGGMPWNTNTENRITGYGGPTAQWWCWRLQAWNPNRDSMLSWLRCVLTRFDREPKIGEETW